MKFALPRLHSHLLGTCLIIQHKESNCFAVYSACTVLSSDLNTSNYLQNNFNLIIILIIIININIDNNLQVTKMSIDRHNRLTRALLSRDLKWVLNQNKQLRPEFARAFDEAMSHFCCAGECENSSDQRKDLSFHGLPLEDKPLLSLWISKMHRNPNYFNVNEHTKICSAHFVSEDFINPEARKRRLKRNVVPSIFAWTKNLPERSERTAAKKLEDYTKLRIPHLKARATN